MRNFYKLMIKKIILLIILTTFNGCQEKLDEEDIDFKTKLDSLKIDYQKNLDTGERMLQTSRKYRLQSDSILELIFNETVKLKNINSDSLKISQKKFISKRKAIEDSLWKEVDSIFDETGMSPELERMTSYGYIGSMNMERARELNKILKNQDKD